MREAPNQSSSVFDDQTLIEHARRMWEAESENARRLAQRANLLLSVMVALFGLRLFKIEWYRKADEVPRVANACIDGAIRLLLVLGLAFIGYAFWKLLAHPPRKNKDNPQSSMLLALDWQWFDGPGEPTTLAREVSFIRTYSAAADLRDRNVREKERLDHAQRPLMVGLTIVLVALSIFMFASSG